jgi:hypothetical protein
MGKAALRRESPPPVDKVKSGRRLPGPPAV